MKTITLNPGERLVAGQLPRQGVLPAAIMQSAQAIVDDVRERGDVALREYCKKFDGVDVDDFRVDPKLMDEAVQAVDPAFIEALKKAAAQIREFHEREVEQSWFTSRADGTILGVKVTPVSAAGVYVPGGRAQYPSTVLMDCIPAKVAGVKRVVMVTPPQKEGGISPYTLAAAKVAGVDEIYAVGGAQAIAALAYGTDSIPKTAKIVGPGNAFVAAAKKIVSGDAGIDMVAGPSEVCVLADATADATVVAERAVDGSLEQAFIGGIDMPEASLMSTVHFDSPYHDLGVFEDAVAPDTGIGVGPAGLLALAFAAAAGVVAYVCWRVR